MLDWKEPALPSSTRVVQWFFCKVLALVGKVGFERRKTLDTAEGATGRIFGKECSLQQKCEAFLPKTVISLCNPGAKRSSTALGGRSQFRLKVGKVQPNKHRPQNDEFLQVLGRSVTVRDLCKRHCVTSAPKNAATKKLCSPSYNFLKFVLSVFQHINQLLKWFKLFQPFWSW